MIKLNNVTKTYIGKNTQFNALDNVTLTIDKGEFISILGPSGSGKSTALYTISGLLQPSSGTVTIGNTDMYSISSSEKNRFLKTRIGFVYQQFHLLPYLSLLENILLHKPKETPVNKAFDLINTCGLSGKEKNHPSKLSIGERQRAAFIRAIITEPDILLADEPTGNLDPKNAEAIMSLMSEFNKKGKTVVIVTHEKHIADYAKRSISINNGKI
jgi:ABC-type lipoprotein export system ATPase subunit